MKYRIKKFNYLCYELEDLTLFLRSEANKGYRLKNVFSGFFLFEKSNVVSEYTVVEKENVNLKECDRNSVIYLDKYLDIVLDSGLDTVEFNNIDNVRKKILLSNSFAVLGELIFIMLDIHFFRYQFSKSSFNDWFMFFLSILLYTSFDIFCLGELIDYIINKNRSSKYTRSRNKIKLFKVGDFLENLSMVSYVLVCVYLCCTHQYLSVLLLVIAVFIEMILRYQTSAGFFFYLFQLGFVMNLCFMLV